MNYYEVLRVDPSCNAKGLEAAYHRLARTHHPDHNASADTAQFALVTEAYRTLRDPEKRAEYDQMYGLDREESSASFSRSGDLFDDHSALDDAEAHAKILMLLYKRRRSNPQDAGVVAYFLQDLLKCSHDELEFHKWYLKEKGFVVTTEQGTIAITIQGIDHVISMSRTTRAEKLLISHSRDNLAV
jgi:curved DNA-binding protein